MSERPSPLVNDGAVPAPRTAGARPLGWGASLAVAGMAIFAVGLLFIGMAFDSMTVDQSGQWLPIAIALGVMAFLVIGLALRSRIAFAVTIALAGYQLLTSALAVARTGMVGPWQFGLISIVPALLVLVGLAASWRAYWRPRS